MPIRGFKLRARPIAGGRWSASIRAEVSAESGCGISYGPPFR